MQYVRVQSAWTGAECTFFEKISKFFRKIIEVLKKIKVFEEYPKFPKFRKNFRQNFIFERGSKENYFWGKMFTKKNLVWTSFLSGHKTSKVYFRKKFWVLKLFFKTVIEILGFEEVIKFVEFKNKLKKN